MLIHTHTHTHAAAYLITKITQPSLYYVNKIPEAFQRKIVSMESKTRELNLVMGNGEEWKEMILKLRKSGTRAHLKKTFQL